MFLILLFPAKEHIVPNGTLRGQIWCKRCTTILYFRYGSSDTRRYHQSIKKRLEHPILGYSRWQHGEYLNAIVNWYYQQYQTDIKPEWITYSPSVMYSIAKAIELLTSHGDNILVFTPVYNAFFDVIKHSERNILTASLIIKNEGATLSTGKILILRLKAQRWCYYVILITRQEQSGRKKNCIKSLQAVQGIMSGYVQMKSIVILFLIVALHPRLK